MLANNMEALCKFDKFANGIFRHITKIETGSFVYDGEMEDWMW